MFERNRDYWIQTYSGKKFYPLDPQPEDIRMVDIAVALSRLPRYTGHTRQEIGEPNYTVAQHSVHVAAHCGAYWEEGLLHDAAEAIVNDIARPIKKALRSIGVTLLDEVEEEILKTIFIKFDLIWPVPPIVKEMDNRIVVNEATSLMSPVTEGWTRTFDNCGSLDLPHPMEIWTTQQAFKNFMDCWESGPVELKEPKDAILVEVT